jgi:hypothetical protein
MRDKTGITGVPFAARFARRAKSPKWVETPAAATRKARCNRAIGKKKAARSGLKV